MSPKKVLIFALVFISLAAIYIFMETPNGKRDKKEQPGFLFEGFKMESAALVKVKSAEKGEFVLTRNEKSWTVKNNGKTYTAAADAVEKLLDAVTEMKIETVASKNAKNFDSFEVTEKNGIEISILDSSKSSMASLVIGKSGPDLFSTYIRNRASDQVILTTGMLKNDFGRDLNEWRDKKVYDFKSGDITEYIVTDNMTLHLKKENNRWQSVKPENLEIDQKKIKEITGNFADLETASFSYDNDTKCGFDKPSKTIKAIFSDNSKETLIIGKDKNAFQFYAKKKGGDTTYIIEKYNLDSICPSPVTLIPEKTSTDNETTVGSSN